LGSFRDLNIPTSLPQLLAFPKNSHAQGCLHVCLQWVAISECSVWWARQSFRPQILDLTQIPRKRLWHWQGQGTLVFSNVKQCRPTSESIQMSSSANLIRNHLHCLRKFACVYNLYMGIDLKVLERIIIAMAVQKLILEFAKLTCYGRSFTKVG
jgi:hypothetical protein